MQNKNKKKSIQSPQSVQSAVCMVCVLGWLLAEVFLEYNDATDRKSKIEDKWCLPRKPSPLLIAVERGC